MSPPPRTKPCKRCGTDFVPRSNHSLYCSAACKQRTATCGHCKRVFVVTKGTEGKFCSPKCFYDFKVPVGSVRDGGNGYTITKVPPGTPGAKLAGRNRALWMWSHRYVTQLSLGRPLLKTEQVHHKNGKRDDNRPENLELWKHSHPAGVRAADYHCSGCRCFD